MKRLIRAVTLHFQRVACWLRMRSRSAKPATHVDNLIDYAPRIPMPPIRVAFSRKDAQRLRRKTEKLSRLADELGLYRHYMHHARKARTRKKYRNRFKKHFLRTRKRRSRHESTPYRP